MSLKDWIKFPEDHGSWGVRANAWMNQLTHDVRSTSATAIPFGSADWEEFGGSFEAPSARKMGNGLVALSGLFKNVSGGTIAPGPAVVIGVLPVGLRPAATQMTIQVGGNNVAMRIDIQADGDIVFVAGAGSVPNGSYIAVNHTFEAA